MKIDFESVTLDADALAELSKSDDPQTALTAKLLSKFLDPLLDEMVEGAAKSSAFYSVEALANLFSNTLTNFILIGELSPDDAKRLHNFGAAAALSVLQNVSIEDDVLDYEVEKAKRQPHTN